MAIQKKRMTVVCAGLAACSVLVSAATQAQAVSFEEARNFEVGSRPLSVAVGDFNGDGVQDLVVSNRNSNNVSVLLGNGDGSFQEAQTFEAGSDAASVAVGDFNGDGALDLAVGSFQAPRSFAAGSSPASVAVGDFNGDKVLDLVVANDLGSTTVSVLLGNGDGSFQAPQSFGDEDGATSVAVGDFNGDGVQDLAVANSWTNHVSVFWAMGMGLSRRTSASRRPGTIPFLLRWATSMAMGFRILPWPTRIPTTARCSWATGMGPSRPRGISMRGALLLPLQ